LIPVVLAVAASDSSAGAGLNMDLKAIAARDAYGVGAITAVTAQGPEGIRAVQPLLPLAVRQQMEAVLEGMPVRAAKTGALVDEEVVREVAGCLRRHRVPHLVVDPVLRASDGTELLTARGRQALLEELLPLCEVVTPNMAEAEELSGRPVRDLRGMEEAARELVRRGARSALIKGGHLEGHPVDLLFDGREVHLLRGERLPGDPHGTGCALGAALSAELAWEWPLAEAVRRAVHFVREAIAQSIGWRGRPYLIPLEGKLWRLQVLESLRKAASKLERHQLDTLVPEVRSNLAYALPWARGPQEVAAFPGRITVVNGRPMAIGEPCFGASRHVASVVLAVRRQRPELRAAMNVRYGPEVVEACRLLGLEVAEFSRQEEPPEVRRAEGQSLPFGVARALERNPRAEVIFDRGGQGKEAMVRLLGRDPQEVVERALALADLLQDKGAGT